MDTYLAAAIADVLVLADLEAVVIPLMTPAVAGFDAGRPVEEGGNPGCSSVRHALIETMRHLVSAVICLAVIATNMAGARIMAEHDAARVLAVSGDSRHLAGEARSLEVAEPTAAAQ